MEGLQAQRVDSITASSNTLSLFLQQFYKLLLEDLRMLIEIFPCPRLPFSIGYAEINIIVSVQLPAYRRVLLFSK
jgi:hypothetical protein